MAQGMRQRMSRRVPNMCGKLVGKLGAACVRHMISHDLDCCRAFACCDKNLCEGPAVLIIAPYVVGAAHLDRWEGYLADVVLGTQAKDAPHLVHGRTPVHKGNYS
jgi:hypothetical protein